MGLTQVGSGLMPGAGTQWLAHTPLGLPVDLQYLPPDKQREPDADIRKMLIEAIMLVSRGSAVFMPAPNMPHTRGTLISG